MKIKFLRNLGAEWPASPDGDPYHEGEEAEVGDNLANPLIAAKLAEPVSLHTAGATPELTTPHTETGRRGRG